MLRIRIYTVTTGLYISHRGACQVIVCRPVSAHGSELDLFVTYNTPDVQILQPAQFVSSVLCIAFTHSWHCRKIGSSSATSTTTLPPCLNSVCFQCPLLKLRQGVVGGCPHAYINHADNRDYITGIGKRIIHADHPFHSASAAKHP